MLMHLLNLFTMMLPISRFAPVLAWRLAWAFAFIAGVGTIGTPIVYVTVSIGRSLLVSYMASAAQAAVVLQVMLNSNYSRAVTVQKKE